MQIISSYGVELRKQNIPIRQTLEIYRSAVSYLIGIYVQVWEELAEIPDAKRRFNAAEHLVHTTKKNHACFDFDIRFPKMPSYLRRSAIRHALGTVSSETPEVLFAFFLYRRSNTYQNTCERTDHLQCGLRDQYRCSLYHHAGRRNCPGKKIYRSSQ